MRSNIKVLIADDHNLFRAGIIKLLKEHENIIIVGEAENGEELINKYFELSPDVILADIAMPGITGPEAIARLKEQNQDVKALFLSMYEGDEYIYRVLISGGSGLINKSILEGELLTALEKIYNGEKYFSGNWNEESLQRLIEEFESGRKIAGNQQQLRLNYREEQILKLLNKGLNSNEMAVTLNISKKTVDFYRSCLMKKFNLKSAADLIRFAVQNYPLDSNFSKLP